MSQDGGRSKKRGRDEVRNLRKAGSLERDQPLSSHANPLKPRPRVEL
jgi:hypothetical protein